MNVRVALIQFVKLVFIFVIVPAAVMADHPRANTRVYVNREFGFSVEVPFNAPTCVAEPDTQDTGIVIYLDHGIADCADKDQRSYVAIFSDYNGEGEKSPIRALAVVCGGREPTKTDLQTFGRQARRWPATCRKDEKKGFVSIMLGRQSGVYPGYESPGINYRAYLNTPPEDAETNMKAFLAILKTVHFFPSTTDD